MPDLLLKNIPAELSARLRARAKSQRRSMTQEVITILEKALEAENPPFPDPVKGKRPLTQQVVAKGIREGRS